jgi:hypothetical protein
VSAVLISLAIPVLSFAQKSRTGEAVIDNVLVS